MPAPLRPRRLFSVLLSLVMGLAALLAVASPAAAAVEDATPITPGTPFAVQISGVMNVKHFSFTGEAGQLVTISTALSGGSGYQYELFAPDGTRGTLVPQIVGYGEMGVLPTSGQWTLRARNIGTTSSSIQTTLGLVRDVTAGDLKIGEETTATFAKSGQSVIYDFDGVAGDKFVLNVNDLVIIPANGWMLEVSSRLVRPDGTTLEVGSSSTAPDMSFTTLDATGAWKLVVDPLKETTGSMTFTVTQPKDVTGSIKHHEPTPLTYAGTGADVRLSFPAEAGKRLTLSVSDSQITAPVSGTPDVEPILLRPDGTEFTEGVGTLHGNVFTDSWKNLDATGTWTLVLRPSGDTQGSQTLTLAQVKDVTGTTSPGSTKKLKFQEPGQNASYTFKAKQGEALIAELTDLNLDNAYFPGEPEWTVELLGPDGDVVADLMRRAEETYAEMGLPTTGKYTLFVNPSHATIGTATLKLRYPQEKASDLVLGEAVTAEVPAGDTARYRFEATKGDRLTVDVKDVALTHPYRRGAAELLVVRPDGSTWSSLPWGLQGPEVTGLGPLDASGTWSIVVDPEHATTAKVAFAASTAASES